MKQLVSIITALDEFRSLTAAIDSAACPAAFTGLSPVHRAHVAAGVRQEQ